MCCLQIACSVPGVGLPGKIREQFTYEDDCCILEALSVLTFSVDWKRVLIMYLLVYFTSSPQMLTYFAAFEVFFEENLPKLFAHFKKNNLTPDIYLIDW